jgi:hypothetical protein
MAMADYRQCDVCGCKAFYDANLNYEWPNKQGKGSWGQEITKDELVRDNGHKTFIQTPPSPEVVAYLVKWNRPAWVPLYTTLPAAQRQWVGLTDEEVYPLANEHLHYQMEGYEVSGIYNLARAIEAKLKEKNT